MLCRLASSVTHGMSYEYVSRLLAPYAKARRIRLVLAVTERKREGVLGDPSPCPLPMLYLKHTRS